MNYMKQVAQILGVEIGEEFNIESYVDNLRFKFTEEDIGYFYNGKWNSTSCYLYDLLSGKLKLIKIPKSILTQEEKEYLSTVIKPFKYKVEYLYKKSHLDNKKEWISIKMKDDEYMHFPSFKKYAMYKGMELDKKYTLEDLDL